MIEDRELGDDPLTYKPRRRCPYCTALSCLTHSLLDSRNGNTVYVYQCSVCGRLVWDEGQMSLVRLH